MARPGINDAAAEVCAIMAGLEYTTASAWLAAHGGTMTAYGPADNVPLGAVYAEMAQRALLLDAGGSIAPQDNTAGRKAGRG